MRLNRHAVGVVAASATLLVGGGAALAASADGDRGTHVRAAPRQDRREPRRLGRAAAGRHQGAPARSHRRCGEGRPDLVRARGAAARARLGGKPLRRTTSREGADRRSFAAQGRGRLPRASTAQQLRAQLPGHLARGVSRRSRERAPRRSRPRWWRPRRPVWPRRSRTRSSRRTARTQILAKLEKRAERLAKHVFAKK